MNNNLFFNAFTQIYQSINMSSITDYVPNEFQEKIFNDIKEKGLSQSFILQYNLDTFKQYVNKNTFKYYDQFIEKFKGTNDLNFTILILNWSIFDEKSITQELNEKQVEIYKEIDEIFKENTEIKIQENLNTLQTFKNKVNNIFVEVFKHNIKEEQAKKLYDSLNTQLSKYIFNQLMNMMYQNNNNFVFVSADQNKDAKISKDQLINYIKLLRLNEFQSSKNMDQSVCGFCLNLKQNFKTIDGFAYFINKDIMQQSENPLHEVYDLINHEIDHYFQTALNTAENAILRAQADSIDPNDKQIIDSVNTNIFNDKRFLYYLFQRSEFNSRCTDVCNFLLNNICPLLGNESLNNFYEAINNIVKYDTLGIMQVMKYVWFKPTQKIMAIVAFSAVTLKLFPQTKWKILKERLENDFDQYENLSEQDKQIYAEQIKNKFSK